MKKKIAGLLSTLLFTLFVGFYGSCYADTYKSWSISDIKNVLYNIGIYKELNENTVIENINTLETDLQNLVIALNNNNNVYISCDTGTGNSIYILVNNEENIHPYYNNNRVFGFGLSTTSATRYTINIGSGTIITANRNSTQGAVDYTNVVYTTNNIYNSSSGTTIVTSQGYIPEDLFEGYYHNIIWQFDYPSGFQYTIANTTDWTYHGITQGYQINVGSVTDSQYIDNIQYRFGSWNGSEYVWGNFKTLYDYNRNGLINNYFSGSTTNNNGVLTTTFYIDTYNNGNNILQIVVRPDSPELTTHYHYYYVLNNNTSFVGTVIYPGYTFSGDYEQQYNQQEQTNNIIDSVDDSTDEIINTITDNSQVNSMLDETLSGDKIIRDIGFNFVVNPFEDIIKTTLTGFTNALLGSGNETINFSIYNHNYAIHSEDFSLPDGQFKSFITLLCNAFVVYNICKYGFKLYEWINTGRIQNLVNEQNRHQYYLF